MAFLWPRLQPPELGHVSSCGYRKDFSEAEVNLLLQSLAHPQSIPSALTQTLCVHDVALFGMFWILLSPWWALKASGHMKTMVTFRVDVR